MGRATQAGREEPEEHGNHERWLVSYADMMTLLMVLFIVMFAISQVDQRRFDMLKDGMAAGFGSSASPFQGSEGTLSAEGIKPLDPVRPDAPSTDVGQERRAAAARRPGRRRRRQLRQGRPEEVDQPRGAPEAHREGAEGQGLPRRRRA